MMTTTLQWREVRKARTESYREWRDSGNDYVIQWRLGYGAGKRTPKFVPLRLIGDKMLSLTNVAPERFMTLKQAQQACERHANPV